MKKFLLNIYLLILLLSLPYNAYSQVYLPNSNTWNKYVNNALVNAGKYINNNEDKIFDIVKTSYKASKTNSVYISVNNLSLLLISLQKINKSFQNFYNRELYAFTYNINQMPVIIKNNKAYFKLKNEKDIKKWNDTVDYFTDMIMDVASSAGYTTWQTPQSVIDERNKVKRKAEEEKRKAEEERKKAEEEEARRKEEAMIKPDNPEYMEFLERFDLTCSLIGYQNIDVATEILLNNYQSITEQNSDNGKYHEISLENLYCEIYLLDQIDTAYKHKFQQQIDEFKSFIHTIPIYPNSYRDVFMFDNKSYNKLIQIYNPLLKNICKYVSDSSITAQCEKL